MKIECILLIVGICLSSSSGNDLRESARFINPALGLNVASNTAFVKQSDVDWLSEIQKKSFQKFLETLNSFEVYGTGLKRTAARFSKSFQSLNKTVDANLAKCKSDMSKVLEDASKHNLYAMRMLDAWGRPNGGILEGNVRWPGHYYECKEAKSEEISGKWCNSYWGFRYIPHPAGYPVDASLGTCFPSTCSEESIKFLLRKYFNIYEPFPPLLEVTCTTPVSEFSLTTADIIGIVISSIFVACVGIGSVMDGVIRLKRDWNGDEPTAQTPWKTATLAKIMLCFSAISNGEKLLDMTKAPGTIPVLDGIRFISTTWVILGHGFLFIQNGIDNPAYNDRVLRGDPLMSSLLNGTMSVDTFFFLSGVLVTYLGIKQLRKTKGRMNIPLMYLQRYLRLTPVYAYLILFSVGLYKYTGSGPYWQYNADSFYNQCKDTWYSNLLYINNFYPASLECFPISWYLANDMQFYILSPIFLLLLYRSKTIGILSILLVLVGSILTTGLLTWYNHLEPYALQVLVQLKPYFRFFVSAEPQQITYEYKFEHDTYVTPWCRIGVYMIGMLTGYILFEYKGKIRMPKIVAVLGWMFSTAVSCAIIYGLYPNFRDSTFLDFELATVYEAFIRPAWGLCMAWVVVACASGYGGPITTFLDWPVFTPLSRLTFSVYLIHPVVYMWYINSQESPMHFLTINAVYYYLGTLVISFGCAFIVSLFVEFPVMCLMKIMFPTSKSKTKVNPLSNGENTVASQSDMIQKKNDQHSMSENGDSLVLKERDLNKQKERSSFENGGYQIEILEQSTPL